ncbi:MAG: signal peptidase I [Promethearchaeati archaeon SRVP18_Atabeyarchaeia-1]
MPKKSKNSSAKEIIKFGIVIAIIIGGVLGANVALQAALGTPIPIVVVTSGSMVPTINVGDVCVIQRVSPDQYVVGNHTTHTGDIIVWDATGILQTEGNEPVIHRIVDRRYNNGTGHFEFLTEGDNNFGPDRRTDNGSLAWFQDARVYGKVTLIIPWIGNIFLFLRGGGVWLVVLVLAVIIVLMFVEEMSKIEKKAKEKLETNPNGKGLHNSSEYAT